MAGGPRSRRQISGARPESGTTTERIPVEDAVEITIRGNSIEPKWSRGWHAKIGTMICEPTQGSPVVYAPQQFADGLGEMAR